MQEYPRLNTSKYTEVKLSIISILQVSIRAVSYLRKMKKASSRGSGEKLENMLNKQYEELGQHG